MMHREKTENKNRLVCILLILCMALQSASCGSTQSSTTAVPAGPTIYYLDNDGDALVASTTEPIPEDTEQAVTELLARIQNGPSGTDALPLLPEDVVITGHTLERGILTLDFSRTYTAMEKTREVLVRAGIVRTMVQIGAVNYVMFTVGGSPAVNGRGDLLGRMNADSFVENTGRQINSYLNTSINLYFADAEGKALRREVRSIYYNSNKPLEWAIVERLIAGPKVADNYAVMPANTRILSVATADGICYVNLSAAFVDEEGYSFPVYFDTTGSAASVYQAFAIPMTIVVNENGEIAAVYNGALSGEQVTALISELLP